MDYCSQHEEMKEKIDKIETKTDNNSLILARIEERLIAVDKRINGSIDAIQEHIQHGTKWRLAIVVVALGLITFAVNRIEAQAKTNQLVEINTQRWERYLSNQGLVE